MISFLASLEKFKNHSGSYQANDKDNDIAGDAGDNDVNTKCQSVFNSSLKAVENLFKITITDHENKDDKNAKAINEGVEKENNDKEDVVSDEDSHNLITDKLIGRIKKEMQLLKMSKISNHLSDIFAQLSDWSNSNNYTFESANKLSRGLEKVRDISDVIGQYERLTYFYVQQQASTLRETSKMCSILLRLFAEVCEKGFCTPAELAESGDGGEGATDFEDIEGGGMGEGEGIKDVSEQIEFEEQVTIRFLNIFH